MLTLTRRLSSRLFRFVSLLLCGVLLLTSVPVINKNSRVLAQRETPKQIQYRPNPYKDKEVMTPGQLIAESRRARPVVPGPPDKPSTLCGFRDEVCQRIRGLPPGRIGQNTNPSVTPDPDQEKRSAGLDTAPERERKNNRGLFRRIGGALSGFWQGATSASDASAFRGNAFAGGPDKRMTASPVASSAGPVSAATAVVAPTPPVVFTSLNQARMDPRYRTGGAHEDLFSGNMHDSIPLVSLPGRNGLDLNITLHYNSLVWIRYNNTMEFDYDYYPTLTPGFRLGFPELTGPVTIDGVSSYMAILPSGYKTPLRQTATNRYEAIDSSYLYLATNYPVSGQMTLFTLDGTQFIYSVPPAGGGLRCTQVRDGNGNFLTVNYAQIGVSPNFLVVTSSITDTLGRVINFNYDNNLHLVSITQAQQNQTYTHVVIGYGTQTIQTNFPGLSVVGPANGATIPVITGVYRGDGARYIYNYNNWGQVAEIQSFGEVNNLRSIMTYAYPAAT
ncbi:MAG: hypothetical protein ACKV2V_08665, partial [Blastocatellia bacterium]